MTSSIDRRPLFIDEILFEIGHFLLFGALAWFCIQEGDTIFAAGLAVYTLLNAARLAFKMRRGTDRPAQPWRLQMIANAIAIAMSLALIYTVRFHLEESSALELMIIAAAVLTIIGSGSIVARGLRGRAGRQ